MVTCDYLFIMNHHGTVYRPLAVLIPHIWKLKDLIFMLALTLIDDDM